MFKSKRGSHEISANTLYVLHVCQLIDNIGRYSVILATIRDHQEIIAVNTCPNYEWVHIQSENDTKRQSP
jgi:hypothetical protein